MKAINYAIVFVRDMKRSIAFYRDVMGFPLKFDSPDWTEFATEGTTLALHLTDKPSAPTPAHNETPSGLCFPGFQVPDIMEFHARMQAHGVRCIQEPQKQDFGIMLALYADPDGLTLSISQALQ